MTDKVLMVDDESNVLEAYTRLLRRRFSLDTALGGEEALARLERDGPYAVIVSDQRMPGMDGVELLSQARELCPDTTRIMLTGNADQATAMDAVNRGAIFRFLAKPCDAERLALALDAGIRQHQLVTAEKELLERTLKGTLEMLVELLGTLDPISFGRARTMAELAEGIGRELEAKEPWVLGIASVLSQIGILTVPDDLVTKLHTGAFLTSREREIANRVPEIGFNLLRRIPRLEQVAESIFYMGKNFNGSGFPSDHLRGTDIPLGGRILRVTSDYLNLRESKAVAEMECRTAWYDLAVVRALSRVLKSQETDPVEARVLQLALKDLRIGHVLDDDIRTDAGLLLVPAGTRLGVTHLEKLRNFARLGGIREPVAVVSHLAD